MSSRYDYLCASEDRYHYDTDFVGGRIPYFNPPEPPTIIIQQNITTTASQAEMLEALMKFLPTVKQTIMPELVEESTSLIIESVQDNLVDLIPTLTQEDINEITD